MTEPTPDLPDISIDPTELDLEDGGKDTGAYEDRPQDEAAGDDQEGGAG